MVTESFLNMDALRLAEVSVNRRAEFERRAKEAFVPAGDPSMADPAVQGGAPMDPAMMGGAPGGGMEMPPPMAGSAMQAMQPMMQQISQVASANKPKIDQNIVLMQILNLLAQICDALGIKVPASQMVATPQALDAMAQQTQAGGAPQPQAPFPPIQPIGGQKQGDYRDPRIENGREIRLIGDRATLLGRIYEALQAA